MAFMADEWAGMMLMLPVESSTSCTCPVVLPGKAIRLGDKQHRPQGLFAVSYADKRFGGFANLYTRTLFCSTTTIRSLDSWTPRTGVRALISRADLLLRSSQRMS